jgi:hypothetical protein
MQHSEVLFIDQHIDIPGLSILFLKSRRQLFSLSTIQPQPPAPGALRLKVVLYLLIIETTSSIFFRLDLNPH